jgi:FkbM family methyltransferase
MENKHVELIFEEKQNKQMLRKVAKRLFAYLVVLKVIKEGSRPKDKIVLFLSIFYSLARYLLNKIASRSIRLCYYSLTDVIIKNHLGMFYCRAQTNDALIVSETHEFPLRQFFKEIEEGIFVDIGAHVGKYTVQVARQLQNGRGKVISIEAHPENYRILVKNIKLNNLTNVIALNVACWFENGKVKLYQDSESTTTAAYSAVETFQGDYVTVDAKKLDNILKEFKIDMVSFMKLDVEEAEFEVLCGAEQLLRRNKNLKIIFESHTQTMKEKCKSILEQYGYTLEYAGISYYLAEPKGVFS